MATMRADLFPEHRAVVQESDLGEGVATGFVGGMLGSIGLGAVAMFTSWMYSDLGFFTPLYRAAAMLVGDEAVMASTEAASRGGDFYVDALPAAIGTGIFVAFGAAAGALFGLIAYVVRFRGAVAILGGIVYGIALMSATANILLPEVGEHVVDGQSLAAMLSTMGWTYFGLQFAVYGLLLGMVWTARAAVTALTGPRAT